MGNPHPTRSKPVKIGRKHTGAKSAKQKAKKAASARICQKITAALFSRYCDFVADYWAGKSDNHPKKPTK